jgi:hypothetical protein
MTLLVALLLAAAEAGPQATIPLEEYERLRRLSERPALTVVDLLHLEGTFAGRDLALVLTGRSSGTMPTVAFLGAPRARLHSCQGDGLVSRAEGGEFELTPLSPRFRVRCRVTLDGSDRLEAVATRAVLEVDAAVKDGELVGAQGDRGSRDFSVVRAIAGAREDLPPSAAGRYQVTLLPEETRFAYRLDVRNPSRVHRRFAVTLREAEHVETVDAPVAWEVDGATWRFDLPPGETTLTLRGRLSGTTFRPPVDASLQYLLIESHPLIRPDVRSGAKRVASGETGLTAAHRGSQAFLLDGTAEVAWTATRLEALKTTGLALHGLEQVFFLGADGQARGEATLQIDNQGAPAITLPTSGEPTFASVGGEASFLTRDAEGRLFLPLAQGAQTVVVQDVRPFRSALGFALARLDLPQAGVPASTAGIELRYPAEWRPVYEELAPASRLHLLAPHEVLLLALLLAGAERLLALAGQSRWRRWLLAGAVTALAALSGAVLAASLALVLGLLAVLGEVWLARRLTGLARAAALLAGTAVVVLAGMALIGFTAISRLESGDVGSAPFNYAAKGELMSRVVGPSRPAAAPPAASAAYQGLPARIELPHGARRTHFSRELLATDAPRPVFVLLVASRAMALLTWLAALAVLAIGLALRRDLAAALRTYLDRLRASPAPPSP